jgi:hypothetical protein
LRRYRYIGHGKPAGDIMAGLDLLSTKANGLQTASSQCGIYSSRNSNLVRLPGILIYNFGFSDSVCMAWGCCIRVLYTTLVVCGVTTKTLFKLRSKKMESICRNMP